MPSPIVAGHPPLPGCGRPKGTKDQHWKKLSYWIKLVENEWPALRPSQRAFIAMDAFKALLKRSRMTTDEEMDKAIAVAEDLVKKAGDQNFAQVTDDLKP